MKTFKLLILVLAVSMAVASCSKDDEEVSNSVSGNKYETTYVKFTIGLSIIELKTEAELDNVELHSLIEFKADGKFYVDNLEEGTWTQTASAVTITTDGEVITGTTDGSVIKVIINETIAGETNTTETHYTKTAGWD